MSNSIIGQRFGMLVAKEELASTKDARGHRIRMFNCLCDCGNEKVYPYHNLLSGMVNSCGCTRMLKNPPLDLTGQRFGKLTVLFEASQHIEKGGGRRRQWVCQCDCGKETTVFQSNLTSPKGTRSCGCMQRKFYVRSGRPVLNLTGNRYGRLVVIGPAEPNIRGNGYSRSRWLCRCDCGKEKIVMEDNLVRGHTRSCGCMKSNGLKNKQFGMLTVVSKPVKGERNWTCRCACGNEIIVNQDDLFWGTITNCGCREKDIQKTDLTGQRFGRLTVMREIESGTDSDGKSVRLWLCRCDCGREVTVRQRNLISKVTRSCGCLRTKKRK